LNEKSDTKSKKRTLSFIRRNTNKQNSNSTTTNSAISKISNPVYEALKEGKLVLSVEISDYVQLNCVKKFSDFFDVNLTINEVIHQIAKKKKGCIFGFN